MNCSGTSITHSVVTGSKATQGLENTGEEDLGISLRKNRKWSEMSARPTGELSLQEQARAHAAGRTGRGADRRHRPALCRCQKGLKQKKVRIRSAGYKSPSSTDHLTCLLRNLYADQEATVRTRQGTTGWFQIRKGVRQGCILSPCLFNSHAEYVMRNAGLDESPAGIKIARRNINNLRYADDTTLMAEREEEMKSFLMKVKEESEKAGLKLNIQKK